MTRAVVAAIACASLAACTGGPPPNPDFHVIGHRGAPLEAPENTIPSFEAAVDGGANAIEVDVCITSDGHFVIWHDRDPDDPIAVARQLGLEGLPWIPEVPDEGSAMRRPIERLTLAELRATHGYRASGGATGGVPQIPTLDDLLAWAARTPELVAIYVDVKLAPSQTAAAEQLVAEIAAEAGAPELEHVSFRMLSPSAEIVRAMASAAETVGPIDIRVMRDFEDGGELASTQALGTRDVSTGLTPARTFSTFIEDVEDAVAARDRGEIDSVVVWTFDRHSDHVVLLFHDVDGIMTNRPRDLARFWRQTL